MIKNTLFKLYAFDNQKTRQLVIKTVLSIEKGEIFSETLRKIYSHYHNIEVGLYSYGGCFSSSNVSWGTRIGRYCSFAREISIFGGNHPLDSISLHPFFYNPVFGYVDELLISRKGPVVGNDVWMGHHVVILPSVSEIGHGAVIGAGSVVTKNVPPYAVFAGNPAKLIRYRFSEKVVEELVKSQWWAKDINEMFKNKKEFMEFIIRHNESESIEY